MVVRTRTEVVVQRRVEVVEQKRDVADPKLDETIAWTRDEAIAWRIDEEDPITIVGIGARKAEAGARKGGPDQVPRVEGGAEAEMTTTAEAIDRTTDEVVGVRTRSLEERPVPEESPNGGTRPTLHHHEASAAVRDPPNRAKPPRRILLASVRVQMEGVVGVGLS